jgi:hypothetical protein
MLTVLTLLVACFSQMDIVIHAGFSIFQRKPPTARFGTTNTSVPWKCRSEHPAVVAKAGLRLVSGLLGLLLERSDIVSVTQTRVCTCSFYSYPISDRLPIAWLGHLDFVSKSRRGDQTKYVNSRGSFGTSHTRGNGTMVRVILYAAEFNLLRTLVAGR